MGRSRTRPSGWMDVLYKRILKAQKHAMEQAFFFHPAGSGGVEEGQGQRRQPSGQARRERGHGSL
eukprot:814362-Alexandrium_andersonii.AAC.1